jgi:hypothetical protein
MVFVTVTVEAVATPDAVHPSKVTGDKSATQLPPLDVRSTYVHAAARIQGQQNTEPSSNRTLDHRDEKLVYRDLEEYHSRSSKTLAAGEEVGLSQSSTNGRRPQNTSFPDAEMQGIAKVLKNGVEFLKLESGRNLVLILWNRDASRKALTEYINRYYIVESLKAGETYSGEFVLEDGHNSSGPNIWSYFIEIFVSTDMNTVFCAYNISNKSSRVIHEIASVYFLKRILNSARKVKIILSMSCPSDVKDLNNENLLALVIQSAKFISDVNKFNQSVALIVSEEGHRAPKRQAREIITDLAELLKGAKTFVSEKYQLDDTSAGEKSNSESVIQLLDALLMNDSNGYVRIGILRQADADMRGSSDSEGDEMGLGKLIRDHTTFVEQENDDFRHVGISEELKNKTEMFAKYSNEEIRTKMALVGGDILKFYRSRELQTRDVATLLQELQEACNLLSDMTSNMSQLPDPRRLTRTIGSALKTLKINIDIDNLIDVVRQFTYLEIFQIISGHDSALTQITDWIGPVRKTVNEIRDSKDWITFLFDMREKLLERGTKAITPGRRGRIGSVGAVFSTDRKEFLTKIERYGIEGYENISHIDDVKLNMLGRARRKIQNEKTTIYCLDGDAVLARGAYVRLSEVLLYNCTGKVKSIEIFASDAVLVDAHISRIGGELRVRILAPQWRLTGQRSITLNGDAGLSQRPQRAENGRKPGWEGKDGKPGLQEGNAGSYFGISNKFIGGNIAVYRPDGGIGGRGQDGGNGAEGKRGNDAQIPSSGTRCNQPQTNVGSGYMRTRLDKWKWRWECFCFYDLYEYEFYGSKGSVGGRGGNGGEGGLGGMGGHSKHIKLHDVGGSWDIVGRNGRTGQNGRGGTGGEGGPNGNTVRAQCKSDWYVVFSIYRWSRTGQWSAGRSNRGQDGIPGGNKQLTTKPPKINEFENELSTVINRYKDYLISSLDHRIDRKSLIQFIMLLGSDIRVQNTYDTLALVNEMQTLENRFYQRSTDVDFLPFYQSFLKRITQYAANRKLHENSTQNKKVLSYLYIATLSKIRALRQSSECILVTDMDGYLDVTLQHIRRIEEIRKLDAVARISKNYKDKIDEKIISADDFINREVLPEIEVITKDTEGNIDSLLLEIIEKEKNAREEQKALGKKRKELANSLLYKKMSEIANFIGVALSVLNPAAQTAQNLAGQVNSVSKDLALVASRGSDHTSINLPPRSWSLLKRQFDAVRSVANTTLTAFRHQITAVLRAVAENPIYLGDMEKTVKGIEERLTKVGQLEVGEVRKLRNELMGEISRKEKELQKLNDRHKRDTRVTKRFAGTTISAVLTILKVSVNVGKVLFGKYKEDTLALEEIDRAIKKSQERLQELNKYEDKIQNSLLPMIRAVERELEQVRNNLASQSKVSLRVTSWRVQASLKEVKLHLRQITAGFEVEERLALCVEKLDDAMTTLIDIYDRIEGYTEQKELADYVADIASAGSDNILIPDRNLRSAISTLEKTISVNILLGQYGNVVAAIKQWVFPFADLWLYNFNLPSHLMINTSHEDIASVVTNQIRALKIKLTEYKTSIMGGVHSHIHRAHFSSAYKSAKPFYVWDNKKYKLAIMDLLAGKEVVLKADILNGVKNNAVKFNVIEINFKAARTEIQHQLDKLLVTFHVKLTHHGNSHYKCGNSFYVIRGDNQTIEYSMEKTGDGQPVDYNYVYTRLRNGDMLLSPYAMWSVRLVNVTNVDFKQLRTLGNFVDLELAGEGQYVSQGDEVCNRDLHEYYALDESFCGLDRVV